jgi:hypothetical protein
LLALLGAHHILHVSRIRVKDAAVGILQLGGTIMPFVVEFWWCGNRFQIPSSCNFVAENVSPLGSEALLLM